MSRYIEVWHNNLKISQHLTEDNAYESIGDRVQPTEGEHVFTLKYPDGTVRPVTVTIKLRGTVAPGVNLTPPGAPQNFTNNQLSSSSLRTDWVAGVDTGSGITGYRLREIPGATPSTGFTPDPDNDTVVATLGDVDTYDVTGLGSDEFHRYWIQAIGGNGLYSDPSNVDGALTAPGGQWPQYSPGTTAATLQMLPWTMGYSQCKGGSGRDSITGGTGDLKVGGVAAATTVYWVENGSEWITATQATGRRYVLVKKSGLYNFGSDFGIDLASGYVTIIDLSPSPGACFRGMQIGFGDCQHVAIINMRILARCDSLAASTYNNCIAAFDSDGDVDDLFVAYNTMAYGTDQTFAISYRCNRVTLWGNLIMKPTHFGSFHDDNQDGIADSEHGTGVLFGWRGTAQNISMHRNVISDSSRRNPLTGAVNMHITDNVINNANAAVQLANQAPTSGYPTFTNIENNVFVRGPDYDFNKQIELGSPGSELHPGSRVYVNGNRGIGITDTTQADLIQDFTGISLESSRLASATSTGYAAYAIPAGSQAEIDRVTLITDWAGAAPLERYTFEQDVIDACQTNSVTQPGAAGGWLTEGEQVYPSGATNTADYVSGPVTLRGISSMSTSPQAVTTAGRTIQSSGYTALEEDIQTVLASKGIERV